jgi:hypothetical protein
MENTIIDKSEVWKDVLGFEGRYEVSNRGRVRALFSACNGQWKPGRLLKPQVYIWGYLMVTLYKANRTPKDRSIHSLVLEAFKGARPAGQVCRHLNGVRTHNHIENLEWGTYSDNASDAKLHGTFVIGEKNGFSKLNESEVRSIRRLRLKGWTLKSLGRKFNTHFSNVMLIVKRRTWAHVK